jgi:hypothetical protein
VSNRQFSRQSGNHPARQHEVRFLPAPQHTSRTYHRSATWWPPYIKIDVARHIGSSTIKEALHPAGEV